MARLLNAVYSDALDDGDEHQLLDDLIAADRYGLTAVKHLAESTYATASSQETAVDALATAKRLGQGHNRVLHTSPSTSGAFERSIESSVRRARP